MDTWSVSWHDLKKVSLFNETTREVQNVCIIMAFNYKKRSSKRCRFCGAMYVSGWDTRGVINIHFQTHGLDREDSSLQLTVSSKCDHSPFQSLQSYHILAQVHVNIQSNMTVCICEKVQFWLLAKLLNVQETTSYCISKVKWSPGCFSSVIHSYLFIPKKKHATPAGMIHRWMHLPELYFTLCLCVCVCASVTACTPVAHQDVFCLSPRLLSASFATWAARWQLSGQLGTQCPCVGRTKCQWWLRFDILVTGFCTWRNIHPNHL